jgi:hypothetical protein
MPVDVSLEVGRLLEQQGASRDWKFNLSLGVNDVAIFPRGRSSAERGARHVWPLVVAGMMNVASSASDSTAKRKSRTTWSGLGGFSSFMGTR